MCGFAGWSFSDKKVLQKISSSIQKRAKSEAVYYIRDELSFFHAPLQLSDIYLNTTQPYVSHKVIVWLVWEIYNKGYLLSLLDLPVETDIPEIELIGKCYEYMWVDFVNYLNWEFVIYIYDLDTKIHYIFRDRYWVHSAYYTLHEGIFYFSSQMQDLPQSVWNQKLENIQGIFDYYMFGFSVSPNTFLSEIFVVAPGTYIAFTEGKISTHSFEWYKQQSVSKNFLETFEESVIRRIPLYQKKIFMPISWWADSNLVLHFLRKNFSGEIIPYTFANPNNTQDVETAIKNMKMYGLPHIIIDVPDVSKQQYEKNMILHEWLVELYDISGKLRELYPEHRDIHIEFSGDGREELFQVNTHFHTDKMQDRYEYLRSNTLTREYSIDSDFLNTSMFDFNLQLIEKLTLWNLIERRLPFTDYELFPFAGYTEYSKDIRSFLKGEWVKIVDGIYGHNTWVNFQYFLRIENILHAIKIFTSLK